MINSMTGFGRTTTESNLLNVTVEIKALNSKFLDIYCRVPRSYSEKEIEIRNLLTQHLERGKIEFLLTTTPIGEASTTTTLNRPLVKTYYRDMVETSESLGIEANANEFLRAILAMPNIYTNSNANEDKQAAEWTQIKQTVIEAIGKCKDFRKQEGKSLEKAFNDSISEITSLLSNIAKQDEGRIVSVRERLKKNVLELIADENFDENRFEQELIYYVEKYDISEEKVRLQNHLTYFIETLDAKENSGKKLNFIAQEIGREINTIGSKANDADIQRLVVQMKDELEKIKEQTANVV